MFPVDKDYEPHWTAWSPDCGDGPNNEYFLKLFFGTKTWQQDRYCSYKRYDNETGECGKEELIASYSDWSLGFDLCAKAADENYYTRKIPCVLDRYSA